MKTTAVKTKEEILSLLQLNEDKIKALGVKRLGLFGSFSRNQQNPESHHEPAAHHRR